MNAKKKILFLCTHNAARSQMAEGFVKIMYTDRYEAYSAGNEPTEVHPCAIEVMAEEGIDIASQRAKSLNEFDEMYFDYVVTSAPITKRIARSFPVAGRTSNVPSAIRCPLARKNRPVDVFVACVTRS
ncbi:MAG: arsenate reductase ArsC, partial [Halobacteriota archaeon]